MIALTPIEKSIVNILINAAKAEKTVTYGEIMKKLRISRRKIGEYLSNIGKACCWLGLPIITSIVVQKFTGKVGKGYNEFEPDYAHNYDKVEDMQRQVFGQSSWSNLSQISLIWTNDIYINDILNTTSNSAIEGEQVSRIAKIYSRDAKLRKEYLDKHGRTCEICGFDPVAKFGQRFENIIEVHHINPVSNGTRATAINDLIAVCPNCHRALHSKQNRLLKPEELKDIIKEQKKSTHSKTI